MCWIVTLDVLKYAYTDACNVAVNGWIVTLDVLKLNKTFLIESTVTVE